MSNNTQHIPLEQNQEKILGTAVQQYATNKFRLRKILGKVGVGLILISAIFFAFAVSVNPDDANWLNIAGWWLLVGGLVVANINRLRDDMVKQVKPEYLVDVSRFIKKHDHSKDLKVKVSKKTKAPKNKKSYNPFHRKTKVAIDPELEELKKQAQKEQSTTNN